jgi:hypothetical protein
MGGFSSIRTTLSKQNSGYRRPVPRTAGLAGARSKTQRNLQISAQLRPRCPATFRFVHRPPNQPPTPRGPSAAAIWPPLRPFIAGEYQLGRFMARRRWTSALYEFLRFGVKQAWACLFGGITVFLIIATWWFYPAAAPLPRYDFLFLCMITVQAALLAGKLEKLDEAKVILIYHVVGTAMEIFKTQAGSWIYPEPNFFRVGGVPLFSGFMYACIGSYLCRAWRLFDFEFFPPRPGRAQRRDLHQFLQPPLHRRPALAAVRSCRLAVLPRARLF